MPLLIDITPLKIYPHYRKIFFGQLVSIFGSQITYVALPWQIYQLSQSTLAVGSLAMAQLIPLITIGFMGGVIADSFERRWICIVSEMLLALCNVALILLTIFDAMTVPLIYVIGAAKAALNAIHRPAFSALLVELVPREDLARVSPLNSFISNFGMIAGPALAGVLIAQFGLIWTYAIDAFTYLFAILMMLLLPAMPLIEKAQRMSWKKFLEGLHYVKSRKDLHGTYLVDILAMTLAFPNPLFPMLALSIAGQDKLGWYYSSIALGALMATLTSRWTVTTSRHGKIITFAASAWGLNILLFGLTGQYFWASIIFLFIAGFFDMISGIFRSTMWNQTIPMDKRGRLASIEMLSYASGPLVGSTVMGLMADLLSYDVALILGGSLCFVLCLILGRLLEDFWNYKAL
jgi:MFS family permease